LNHRQLQLGLLGDSQHQKNPSNCNPFGLEQNCLGVAKLIFYSDDGNYQRKKGAAKSKNIRSTNPSV
jgi:hypothetical protein